MVPLFDAGKIKVLSIICSHFFAKTSAGIYEQSLTIFEPRGIKVYPRRCHVKLLAMKLSDGRTITAEGSANTRSAKTLEQLSITGSREVYGFHVDMCGRAQASTKDRYI